MHSLKFQSNLFSFPKKLDNYVIMTHMQSQCLVSESLHFQVPAVACAMQAGFGSWSTLPSELVATNMKSPRWMGNRNQS